MPFWKPKKKKKAVHNMYFSDVWHTRRVINQMMNILREERESDDH